MEYEVIFSKRKTISLLVKDARLVVRAPYGTPNSRIEKMVSDHMSWINKHIDRQRETIKATPELSSDDIKLLKKRAKEILPLKTEYYAKIMNIKYGRITITSAKTRFGSCTEKGNISYSYRLMQYPEQAIDYVVVHELAHIRELNHSSRFYAIIESVMPDYKVRRKLLKVGPHASGADIE